MYKMLIRHNGKNYLVKNSKKSEYKGFIEGIKFVFPDYSDDYYRALTWWLETNKDEEKQSIVKRLKQLFTWN